MEQLLLIKAFANSCHIVINIHNGGLSDEKEDNDISYIGVDTFILQ